MLPFCCLLFPSGFSAFGLSRSANSKGDMPHSAYSPPFFSPHTQLPERFPLSALTLLLSVCTYVSSDGLSRALALRRLLCLVASHLSKIVECVPRPASVTLVLSSAFLLQSLPMRSLSPLSYCVDNAFLSFLLKPLLPPDAEPPIFPPPILHYCLCWWA